MLNITSNNYLCRACNSRLSIFLNNHKKQTLMCDCSKYQQWFDTSLLYTFECLQKYCSKNNDVNTIKWMWNWFYLYLSSNRDTMRYLWQLMNQTNGLIFTVYCFLLFLVFGRYGVLAGTTFHCKSPAQHKTFHNDVIVESLHRTQELCLQFIIHYFHLKGLLDYRYHISTELRFNLYHT